MRKNVLALSIAAMIGGLCLAGGAAAAVIPGTGGAGNATLTDAAALTLNQGGIGHILTVPYFTTQNGNATLLNLVNTDQINGKAVKVRFRGASNSDDIFDFQVYLSPGDVWTATVSQGADGRSQLATTDNSCTGPALINASFVTDRLPPSFTNEQKAEQTREGYIEIFNMADIPPKVGGAGVDTLYEAIKHTSTGTVACGDSLMNNISTDLADEADAVARGFDTPSTGLTASWIIINVPQAAAYAANATAVEARTGAGAAGRGNIVFFPQLQSAPAGNVADLTADPGFRAPDGVAIVHETAAVVSAAVSIANYDLPDLSTPYVGGVTPEEQASLLTSALAVSSVTNEFLTDPGIAAATDWVFSMPTRRYSVVLDYRAGADTLNKRVFNTGVVGVAPLPVERFFTMDNTLVTGSQICTRMSTGSIKVFDRSERTPSGGGLVISPGSGPTALTLCGEVSVLSWNAGGASGVSVLGATVARKDVDVPYRDGWARINTDPDGAANDAGVLPAQGSAFMKATGPAAAGVSGNFGVNFDHRFTR